MENGVIPPSVKGGGMVAEIKSLTSAIPPYQLESSE
jgi:hypothetical protein